MANKTVFEYGEYEKLHADKRTAKVFDEVDRLANKMKVKYALIGGLAAYLIVKNPPQDIPDIDFQIYTDGLEGEKFIKALTRRPKFELGQSSFGSYASFGMFMYDDWVQVDVFTDLENLEPEKTNRFSNVEVEPVEYLIIDKMISAREHDVKVALDLLAYADYDKGLLHQMARERRLTGVINHMEYFARRIAAGRISGAGIAALVKRLKA